MIPAGKYIARATGQFEFGQSDQGSDFVWLNFAITRGELEHENIGAYLYFTTEKGTARSIESMRYCGCTFPGDDLTNTIGLTANEVELVIEHETWEGNTRAKVKWINAIGGVKNEQKMTPGAKASFKDRMRGSLLASKASSGGGAKTTAPVQSNNLPPGDSDIPF